MGEYKRACYKMMYRERVRYKRMCHQGECYYR